MTTTTTKMTMTMATAFVIPTTSRKGVLFSTYHEKNVIPLYSTFSLVLLRQHQQQQQSELEISTTDATAAAAIAQNKEEVEEAAWSKPQQPASSSQPEQSSLVLLEELFEALQSVVYPETEWSARNAVSRRDGYWPFLKQVPGSFSAAPLLPPSEYTYGEFDLVFFAQLLQKAAAIRRRRQQRRESSDNNKDSDVAAAAVEEEKDDNDWQDAVFVDLGSGAGRLVWAAAALYPHMKVCRGVEILPGLHELALQKQQEHVHVRTGPSRDGDVDDANDDDDSSSSSRTSSTLTSDDNDKTENTFWLYHSNNNDNDTTTLKAWPLAPMEFVCGSINDPYQVYLGDADVLFCFASCLPVAVMERLTMTLGRDCRVGTMMITIDQPLSSLQGTIPPYPWKNPDQDWDYMADDFDDRIPSGGTYSFVLHDTIQGYCWATGGANSTAYIYEALQTQWTPDRTGPLPPPVYTLQQRAYRAIRQAEAQRQNNYRAFVLGVHNNMAFAQLPEPWWPDVQRAASTVLPPPLPPRSSLPLSYKLNPW